MTVDFYRREGVDEEAENEERDERPSAATPVGCVGATRLNVDIIESYESSVVSCDSASLRSR